MIERATSRAAGGMSQLVDPRNVVTMLSSRRAAAEQAGVIPDASEALTVKSLVSGVPVETLAQASGALDSEYAAYRAHVERAEAKFRRDAARSAAATARIDAALARHRPAT